jgi:hypothetical protein
MLPFFDLRFFPVSPYTMTTTIKSYNVSSKDISNYSIFVFTFYVCGWLGVGKWAGSIGVVAQKVQCELT